MFGWRGESSARYRSPLSSRSPGLGVRAWPEGWRGAGGEAKILRVNHHLRTTHRRISQISRTQRIAVEEVLQVSDEQLLVLLLVMDAQGHQRRQRLQALAIRAFEQLLHLAVDVRAIRLGFADRGPRDHAALVAAVARARLN